MADGVSHHDNASNPVFEDINYDNAHAHGVIVSVQDTHQLRLTTDAPQTLVVAGFLSGFAVLAVFMVRPPHYASR